MYSNWKICTNDLNGVGACEDVQNNCERCGKWYRYNWRRRRTRDKTCNPCVNEIKCNLELIQVQAEREPTRHREMNFEVKPLEDMNYCHEKRIWDSPLAMFQYGDAKEESPHKKSIGIHEFTEQLFVTMKTEFAEELRNFQKPFKTDFEWPKTDQLSKVDCLRAFNMMKQILLQEMSICNDAPSEDSLCLRRKFYLERRFQSLEREKIRRLKIYERQYMKDEMKSGM